MTPVLLTPDQARYLRLRAQRLASPSGERLAGPAAIVRAVGGIQAQAMPAAALSIRVRGAGLTAGDVTYAVEQERSIVRLWAMRGTLHLVPAEDVRWLLALYGPRFNAASRTRRLQLGLPDDLCDRAAELIRQALAAHGALTRAELAGYLTERGIPLGDQRLIHLIRYAALAGVTCYGAYRGKQETFVRLDDWVPAARSAPGDAARLARGYVGAFGPATAVDFGAWSGLPAAVFRGAWNELAPELLEVTAFDQPAWVLADRAGWLAEPPPAVPVVRLLAGFDTYLLGYKDRAPMLVAERATRVFNGGMIHPTLTVDGRVVGTWRVRRAGQRIDVAVEPFESLPAGVLPGLEAEVEAVRAFLGSPVRSA